MKDEVAEAVSQWIRSIGLPDAPAAGGKDLHGRGVPVVKFTDEDTVKFFFPKRSIPFQRAMVKALNRILLRRGAHIVSVSITAEDYARWLEARRQPDSPALRYQFASQPAE